MPRHQTIADIRSALGDTADDYSDEEILRGIATVTGMPVEKAAAKYKLSGYDDPGGPWGSKVSASLDTHKAELYGLAESVSSAVGADSAASFAGRRRRANEVGAEIGNARAKAGGIPDSWRDVDGVGSGLRYLGGLGVDAAPTLAEAALGGIAGRAVLGGAGAVLGSRAGQVGAGIGMYPSSVGQVLQAQRGTDSGDTDLASAAALGAPIAALNTVGGVGELASRAMLPKLATTALDGMPGVRGFAARNLAAGVQTGAEQAGIGAAQEALTQTGRMAVDDNESYLSDAAQKRYADAAVGGGALGFAIGGGLHFGRRAEPARGGSSTLDVPPGGGNGGGPHPPVQPQSLLAITFDPHGAQPAFVFPDGSVAVGEDAYIAHRYKPQDGHDPASPLAYDGEAGTAVGAHPADPGALEPGQPRRQAPMALVDTEYPFELAPADQPIVKQPSIPFSYDTGNLSLAPTEPRTPGDATGASAKPPDTPPPPVQGTGRPEALARVEQVRNQKADAIDALHRAQEAGMTSEKQQVLYWRAEELAKQGKIGESQMTQSIALLLQSKFGQVKKMLDDAASGAPNDDGKAIVKEVQRNLESVQKEIDKAGEERATLLKSDGRRYPTGSPKRDRWNELTTELQALRAEKQKIIDHGADKAGVETTATAEPAKAIEPEPAQPVTAANLKDSADINRKITRYESLLSCLER